MLKKMVYDKVSTFHSCNISNYLPFSNCMHRVDRASEDPTVMHSTWPFGCAAGYLVTRIAAHLHKTQYCFLHSDVVYTVILFTTCRHGI